MTTWSGPLTTEPHHPELDLDAWVGQRTATYRFDNVDIVTGYREQIYPRSDVVPTLSHDSGRIIKRTLTNLWFDAATTAALNTISARIEVFMILVGVSFPLGQYLFNDQTRARYTSGVISSNSAYDNGFIVDQPLEHGFPIQGLDAIGPRLADVLIRELLTGLPIEYTLEPTFYQSAGSWMAGTSRGYAVEQLSVDGDWLSPWFDNTNVMRFIRSFDPATAVPTFDFDSGNKVMRDPPPIETDDLLGAANRFVVVSNGSTVTTGPVVGTYDVPSSAPHSIANRGFVIPKVIDRQVEDVGQAQAIAANLGQRQTIFERVELTTAPDPRHDSYDVILWQGEKWLETAWSLPLVEGGKMRHTARKTYS